MSEEKRPENGEQVPKQVPKRRPLTDEERAQLRRKREIEMKRRQQILRDGTQEEKEQVFAKTVRAHKQYEEMVEIKPVTPKQKWDNYWYHYKALTFGIAAVVLIVGFFVYDMVTKEKFDLNIMAVTSTANNLVEYTDEMLDPFAQLVEDVNGDGKQNISVESVVINQTAEEYEKNQQLQEEMEQGGETSLPEESTEQSATGISSATEDPNYVMAQTVRFQVSVGEVMNNVYLVDEQNYEYMKALGITFIDLSQYGDNPNVDGDRYYLKDDPTFDQFPNQDQLMLVVRDIENSSKTDDEEKMQSFEQDLEVVKKLIAQ